jgi:hypothetical protein
MGSLALISISLVAGTVFIQKLKYRYRRRLKATLRVVYAGVALRRCAIQQGRRRYVSILLRLRYGWTTDRPQKPTVAPTQARWSGRRNGWKGCRTSNAKWPGAACLSHCLNRRVKDARGRLGRPTGTANFRRLQANWCWWRCGGRRRRGVRRACRVQQPVAEDCRPEPLV